MHKCRICRNSFLMREILRKFWESNPECSAYQRYRLLVTKFGYDQNSIHSWKKWLSTFSYLKCLFLWKLEKKIFSCPNLTLLTSGPSYYKQYWTPLTNWQFTKMTMKLTKLPAFMVLHKAILLHSMFSVVVFEQSVLIKIHHLPPPSTHLISLSGQEDFS